jgi:hypothetical protein
MLMGAFLAFSLTGCVTILGRRTQGVTVTARPAGARVLVDGAFEGLTPLGLRLAKKPPHVIRIEKEGYRPVEIRMTAHKNWFPIIFPNLFWAGLGLPALANPDVQTDRDRLVAVAFITLGVVTPIAAILLDALSAKSTVIAPRHLSIMLEEDSGGGEPIVFEMDAADFRNLTWISVLNDDRTAARQP